MIGFASGRISKFPVNLALVKGYSVVGVFWGEFARRQPADWAANMEELFAWYRQGAVKPHIDAVLPLAEAPAALKTVFDRQVKGKIILQP